MYTANWLNVGSQSYIMSSRCSFNKAWVCLLHDCSCRSPLTINWNCIVCLEFNKKLSVSDHCSTIHRSNMCTHVPRTRHVHVMYNSCWLHDQFPCMNILVMQQECCRHRWTAACINIWRLGMYRGLGTIIMLSYYRCYLYAYRNNSILEHVEALIVEF